MKLVLVLAALLGVVCSAEAAEPLPFERGSWARLRDAHAGQPVIVHFWGLTCAPCLTELPHWAALQATRPDLKLVLIAADPVPQDPERVTATLAKAGLNGTESWSFTDRFLERLRYEIDPAWAGELPRTVMIDRDGKPEVLAGVADLSIVKIWLNGQTKAH